MKKTFILTLLFLFGVLTASAQNTYFVAVSGHVYQDSAMTAVADHIVNAQVIGSGMVQNATFITDDNGFYSGSFTGFFDGLLEVSTIDCNGQEIVYSVPFSPGNNVFEFDFWICNPAPFDCKASFIYEVIPGNVATYVSFTDLSFGNPSTWNWDFGDGVTSTIQHPTHTYELPGIYQVCLTIATADGSCTDVYCDDIYANVILPECTNWFWYNQSSDYVFEFYAESDPPASDYFWDFGDGTTGTGQTITHMYAPNTGDVFMVTLTSLSFNPATSDSCVAVSSDMVYIYGFPPNDCENWFWYMTTPAGSIDFYGEAFPPAETYDWDFGDGTTGTGQSISHQYDPNLGDVFIVTLVTTSYTANGEICTAVSEQEVFIGNTPGDCFNFFWYEEMGNNAIQLFGESWPVPADVYQWTFPDGTVQYGQQVLYTYDPAMGNEFVVCLDTYIGANTIDSCYAQTCQIIYTGGWSGGIISGTIFTDNIPADQAFAMLYQISPNGTELFDFQITAPNTGIYSFQFVPPGEYYVVGFLSPGSTYFNHYFPTYYGDALYWYDATIINPDDSSMFYNINLIPVSGSGNGNGTVSGNITIESKGDPGANMQVVLMNTDNEPLSFTYSNEFGDYKFENLAYGIYHVKVEMAGGECEIANVELTASNPAAIVNFVIEGSQIFLGLNETVITSGIANIYPNPVDNLLNIELFSESTESITITIKDILGKEIKTLQHLTSQGLQSIQVPVSELKKGYYNLIIHHSSGQRSSMKFLK
ncbi:MAG: PKD domain-containing protein [Bacteroidales bacterium]|nr:PKD domain-containing protein [Bacteroidales bacterium]